MLKDEKAPVVSDYTKTMQTNHSLTRWLTCEKVLIA